MFLRRSRYLKFLPCASCSWQSSEVRNVILTLFPTYHRLFRMSTEELRSFMLAIYSRRRPQNIGRYPA
jgi:hypothetical protein